MKPGALTALLQEVAAAPEKREEEPLSLPPGTVVGRFEITRELGRGGFGVVYEAKDRDLGRQVAVKLVRPGRITEEEGKVSREAEAIARLAHPNLITLFEVGRSEHGPFLVFELLRGKTVDLRIEEGPLPVQEAVHIATEVARGLAHAHAEGVIHRDLKPANVFITNKGQVKILDFGMAHAFGRRRLSGGTPAYMAPEQWEEAPEDERTDVFALGVMLYRMLTGEYPFPEGQGRWSSEPATVRKLDVPGAPELAELVEKMLDPTPTRRLRDGAAVLAALQPIEDRLGARPADGAPPVHAKRRKATVGDLLAELKRRHVFRVMVGYGIFAFAVLQITEPLMHGLHLPDWVLTVVIAMLALGFPMAVVLAWVYDLTAQGVKRTPSASGPGGLSSGRSRLLLPVAASTGVLAIAAAGAGGWYASKQTSEQRPVSSASGGTPSIAVLPFADLSPGKDQEYFSDGIAEEIRNALARVAGLRVPGRTSSFFFKGKNARLEDVGRELRVEHVLEGSVRRSGRNVRIVAEVVRASTGDRVWSETFEREATDIFAIQDEIARAAVTALKVKLLGGQSSLAKVARSDNQEAYESYLLGKSLARTVSGDSAKRELAALEKAVRLDPGFAPAWAALAGARLNAGSLEMLPWPDAKRDALSAADRAVALAPDLPEALAVRGMARLAEWDWAGAKADLDRALLLDPDGQAAIRVMQQYANYAGNVEEALRWSRRSVAGDPLSVGAWANLSVDLAMSGRYEEAERATARALELSPGSVWILANRAFALLSAGRPAEALDVCTKFDPGDFDRAWCEADAYHALGDEGRSREALDVLQAHGHGEQTYMIAEAYAVRGEPDRAFEWLDKAYAERIRMLNTLRVDPGFRRLHGDPRWAALLRKMNHQVDGEPGSLGRSGISTPP